MKNIKFYIGLFFINISLFFNIKSKIEQDLKDICNKINFNETDLEEIKEQTSKIRNILRFSFFGLLKDLVDYYNNDPYGNIKANVRISKNLCRSEQDFLEKRFKLTKSAIETLISRKLKDHQVPRIAICFSGGGYRSMVWSLGYILGLKLFGLLDTVTYLAGTSGSTWSLAAIYGHNKDLKDVISIIREQITKPIYYGFDAKLLIENAIQKFLYGQKMNLVGIWGVLLANILFNDLESKFLDFEYDIKRISKNQMPKLSTFSKKLEDGNMPMPLFTAYAVDNSYKWVEFSPYEIGFTDYDIFIPSWAFSRKFEKGVSTNYAPEFSIDYCIGIWGSAFTVSLKEVLEVYSKSLPSFLFQSLESIVVNDGQLGGIRISPARVPNFAYLLKNKEVEDIADLENITLVDSGIKFNLPIVPVIKKSRNVDILVLVDASANVKNFTELKKAQKYAAKYNIRLPKFNFDNLKQINIFKDYSADIPVVIYMPMMKNENLSDFDPVKCIENSYCSTYNLKYKLEQFDELSTLGYYNLITSIKDILDEIRNFADYKENITK